MYQTISETIKVQGTFQNSHFIPQNFTWNNQDFSIDKITSIHNLKDGGVKKRRYSVTSNANLYLIEYNRDQETWELIQVWFEN